MAIKGPKGAHPTLRGWVNPKTKELLKSQKISQAEIDAFFGNTIEEAVEEVLEDLNNDGAIDQFEGMRRSEIFAWAAERGIEVDRKLTREKLVEALRGLSNA